MILSFRTDMPRQTVQTQIRLLRSSLIRVYTVCHSVCIVWTHYSMVEPHSSNFRVITTIFLGVRIFRKFTVKLSLYKTINKLERICEHESSSKSVKIVANIHGSLQFCSQAALKRHITLSYKYRASEASEEKIHFVSFFTKKY